MLAAAAAVTFAGQTALAEMSDDVIRIGVLNDRSGLYADFSGEGSVVAARLAAEEFGNAINDIPIEILFDDHLNDPQTGGTIVRRWIEEEGIDAVADVPNSSVAFEVQGITHDYGRIFLISSAAAVGLTGESCSHLSFHWAHDTRALAVGTGEAVVQRGGDSWFFITVDDHFGRSLEEQTAAVVWQLGGEVLGVARHELNAVHAIYNDLEEAVASGAEVIGLANGTSDALKTIARAKELGMLGPDKHFAGLLLFLTDIHALGLEAAEGMLLTTGFYWDRTEETRAWTKRFLEHHGVAPTAAMAGTYSAVRHYLKAIQQAGTDDPETVAETMRAMPVNDVFADNGRILANGRMVHDMYLVEVKSPEESRGPWDYYEILATIPGDDAFISAAESGCPLAGG